MRVARLVLQAGRFLVLLIVVAIFKPFSPIQCARRGTIFPGRVPHVSSGEGDKQEVVSPKARSQSCSRAEEKNVARLLIATAEACCTKSRAIAECPTSGHDTPSGVEGGLRDRSAGDGLDNRGTRRCEGSRVFLNDVSFSNSCL